MYERRNESWKMKGFARHGRDFDAEEIREETIVGCHDWRRATTERKYNEFVTKPVIHYSS